jgi:hypothetical protein
VVSGFEVEVAGDEAQWGDGKKIDDWEGERL